MGDGSSDTSRIADQRERCHKAHLERLACCFPCRSSPRGRAGKPQGETAVQSCSRFPGSAPEGGRPLLVSRRKVSAVMLNASEVRHVLATHAFVHIPKTGGSTIEHLLPDKRLAAIWRIRDCCILPIPKRLRRNASFRGNTCCGGMGESNHMSPRPNEAQ